MYHIIPRAQIFFFNMGLEHLAGITLLSLPGTLEGFHVIVLSAVFLFVILSGGDGKGDP